MKTYTEFTDQEQYAQTYIADPFYKSQSWECNRSESCFDYDLTVTSGITTKKVEEKFRFTDYNDFLIELFQDIPTADKPEGHGWFYKTNCDAVFYWVCDDKKELCKLFIIRWQLFKKWFSENLSSLNGKINWKSSIQGKGYTLNVVIKWGDVPEQLYIKYEDIKKQNP